MTDAPHTWTVLGDYAKTSVTLASSLLALSVAFGEKLPALKRPNLGAAMLFVSRLFLVAATIASLCVLAQISGLGRRADRLAAIEKEINPNAVAGRPAPTTPSPAELKALQNEGKKLREEYSNRESALPSAASVSYGALGLAVIFLLMYGGMGKAVDSLLAKYSEAARLQAAAMLSVPPTELAFKSLNVSAAGDRYTLEYVQSGVTDIRKVEISAKDGTVLHVS